MNLPKLFWEADFRNLTSEKYGKPFLKVKAKYHSRNLKENTVHSGRMNKIPLKKLSPRTVGSTEISLSSKELKREPVNFNTLRSKKWKINHLKS
jgi:hypothetical protein